MTASRHSRVHILVSALLVSAALLMTHSVSLAQSNTSARLRLVQSDAERVVLELEIPDYAARTQVVNGAQFIALSVPGLGHTNEPGKPQLPTRGALVGIPQGAEVSLKIIAGEARAIPLAHPPLPSPAARVVYDPAETLPRWGGNAFAPDTRVDSSAQLYPPDAARLASIGAWRSQRYAVVEFHPVQYNPAKQQLLFHRYLRAELTFGYPHGRTAQALGTAVNEGPFETIFQNALANYQTAKNWRAPRAPQVPTVPQSSAPWYKIALDRDGIYRLTCAQLADAGINSAALDLSTLKILKQGAELALRVQGAGACDGSDYVEFFGQAATTKYTNTNIYWLTFGGAAGKRMTPRANGGTGAIAATFTDTLRIEEDHQYVPYLPFAEEGDHWYWNAVPHPYDPDGNGDPNSADYRFTLSQPASGAFTATLRLTLAGFSEGNHHTRVYLNTQPIYDATWSGRVEHTATVNFSQNLLSAGANTLRVAEAIPYPNFVYINRFDLDYARTFTATNDMLRFRQSASGTGQYQLNGFSSSDVEVFDITDPLNVAQIVGATVTPNGAIFSLAFADALASREYLALTPARRLTPSSISQATASNLRSSNNGADYIIIAPKDFVSNLQSLISYRQAQGLRVKVVNIQDVYDEFSDGVLDPQAMRDFLAYAYANWQAPAPAFVLLAGDGNLDFKNNYGMNDVNYVPPYLRLVDPWLGETASDNRLVAFNSGNNLPSMAIGRLPARTPSDVDAMVAKILHYEQDPPAGDWRTKIAFVADNAYQSDGTADSAGNFWALSDAVASDARYLPAPFTPDRIYYNPCDASSFPHCALPYPLYSTETLVRSALVSAINEGRLIVNYVGHAAIQYWGGPALFRLDEVNMLANGGKTPVILAMTCYDGYFHSPAAQSIAETNVRLAGHGAVASWSATGLGIVQGHDLLDRGFFEAVMQLGVRQLGPATVLGKLNQWLNGGGANLDLLDTFILLGDPATRLALPSMPTPTPVRVYLPLMLR